MNNRTRALLDAAAEISDADIDRLAARLHNLAGDRDNTYGLRALRALGRGNAGHRPGDPVPDPLRAA